MNARSVFHLSSPAPWRLLVAGGCLSAASALAAPACRAPVVFAPQAREELVAVTLSSNVFAASRDDYADLRVLDDAGRPVPFVLETLAERHSATVRRDCPAYAPQARELEGQALEIVSVLDPKTPSPTGLTIDTPLRNFRQRVKVEGSVEGSTDSSAWRVLADGAVLYDLSRFVDVRHCEVSWGTNGCRRFRITFFDATRDRPDDVREVTSGTGGTNVRQNVRTEPFRVNTVRFWRTEAVEAGNTPVRKPYLLTQDPAASKPAAGQFVFRSTREPLLRITFDTTNRLFHRSYRLYGRNEPARLGEDTPGRLLASGMLTQIQFQEISRRDLAVDFPASRFREYVLQCEPSAGEEADITVARAEGIVPQVIFAATPGKSYALLFGDPDAEYPALPEAATIRTLLANQGRLVQATVGDVAGAPAAPRTWRGWLNSPTAMIVAIVIAGILLTLVLVSAGRKMNQA